MTERELINRLAERACERHYATRFKKPADDQHVQLNVSANWGGYVEPMREVVEDIKKLMPDWKLES